MKTLVLGGSTNPERYSFKAIKALQNRGLEAISIGRKEAELDGVPILTGKPILENIDTITIYMGAKHQLEYEDYLLALAPRRIIFNPGAENRISQVSNKGVHLHVVLNDSIHLLHYDTYTCQ